MDTPLMMLTFFLSWLPIIYLLTRSRKSTRSSASRRLPPGPLGIPIIGQTLAYLNAMRLNKAEEWIGRRIEKYGPVSKLSILGTPTVLVAGPAANKFLFTNVDTVVLQQPQRLAGIIGMRNIIMLHGEEHRRVRGVVAHFLRPEVLKQYVGRMDKEARQHIDNNWTGRQNLKAQPLMKSFTFDVICSLVFGIEHGAIRDKLLKHFDEMFDGLWAALLGLPFLNLNKSMRAAMRIRNALSSIIQERKARAQQGHHASGEDLITCLVGLGSENSDEALTDDEIIDNAMLIMFAGYDTTSILITFLIRKLGSDPMVRAAVVREQEEIANSKASSDEPLTWDDIAKMKYTWRVALEILRMIPPVMGGFRKVLKDVEYHGFLVPEGWNIYWVANVTHMDANIFQDPTEFDPARFENPVDIPPYSMVSFGGGPRICPGSEFARLETLVMIHHLVTKFEWELCGKDDTYTRFPMPSPVGGLPIQLHPKK